MELGFVNEPAYGIDACLWSSGLGADGAAAMGKIVKGELNPSAKLVNTYVYDNFSSPTMQNMLNEMKRSEQDELFGKGGYGTMNISTAGYGINKPKTYEYDTIQVSATS